MQAATLYDADLQMFRQSTREADLATLRFLRWLAERGRLEHLPVAPPSGYYAELSSMQR